MYKFGTRIKVESLNIRQLQYNIAMSVWGAADPIVIASKSSRKAQSLGRRQYTDLERIQKESVA